MDVRSDEGLGFEHGLSADVVRESVYVAEEEDVVLCVDVMARPGVGVEVSDFVWDPRARSQSTGIESVMGVIIKDLITPVNDFWSSVGLTRRTLGNPRTFLGLRNLWLSTGSRHIAQNTRPFRNDQAL